MVANGCSRNHVQFVPMLPSESIVSFNDIYLHKQSKKSRETTTNNTTKPTVSQNHAGIDPNLCKKIQLQTGVVTSIFTNGCVTSTPGRSPYLVAG